MRALSQQATTVRTALAKALPEREWRAVDAWLSTFFPYQLEWLLDPSRFAVLIKARQIGGSHVYGAWSTLHALLGETTTIVSKGEREAYEVIEKAERHARVLAMLGSNWAKAKTRGPAVRFASGGRVIALPSTSGGRGYSGNVVLDEFAYLERPAEVWDAAAGAVLHNGALRVLSTPNGSGNLFHQLCTDSKANAGYRIHRVTLDEAIEDGLAVNMQECWSMARGDTRVFDQLFRCAFLDGDAQYIQSTLLELAFVDSLYVHGGQRYAGIDVGKSADRTVLHIIEVDEFGVAWLIHAEEAKRTSQADLERMAATAMSMNVRRLCIDSTGIGAFPAETLQRRYGRHRIEPVVFTQQSKEDLATTLYQYLVEEKLKLPRKDTALRDDLCSLRRIVTSAGNIRYDAPHTDAGHADRAWALALALHGASGPDRRKAVIIQGQD